MMNISASAKSLVMLSLSLLLAFTGCLASKNGSTSTPAPAPTAVSENFYSWQWHLINTGQGGGTAQEDIDVAPVWAAGNRGENVNVLIIDDGLEVLHPDLKDNISPTVSGHNYLTNSTDPSPEGRFDGHGTCVGGVVAGAKVDGMGASGVAPKAQLVGNNLLMDFTEANLADALTYHATEIQVVNNSWGNVDTGHFYEIEEDWTDALWSGLNTGRGGRGTIYVWAGGNGGDINDLSLYDPFSAHMGMITVAAVDNHGQHLSYSEGGANLWVSAPSGDPDGQQITTSDLMGKTRGFNRTGSVNDYTNGDYTNTFNGTSAAAPIVSGVAALVVAANPNLTWRDVKLVLAESARKNDPTNAYWQTNGAGMEVNFFYGMGVVDAYEAVELAKTWNNVPALQIIDYPTSGPLAVNQTIDSNSHTLINSTINITGSTISKIEYVEVILQLTYYDWGKLKITLERAAPNINSVLATPHYCYNGDSWTRENCIVVYNQFTFGSTRHLYEDPNGDWNLKVEVVNPGSGQTGTFLNWSMKVYGH